MWDATNFNLFSGLRKRQVECCGIPHLAKNERDMGHPTILGRRKTGFQIELLSDEMSSSLSSRIISSWGR
jgi:hypothetical protein